MLTPPQRITGYLLGAIMLAPVLAFAVMWWITSKFVAPVPLPVVWPATLTVTHEDTAFAARDGIALKGWFLPAPGSTTGVVLLHSISLTRAQMLGRAVWLHSLGYNVLLYDARGCGESAPAPRSFGRNETQDLLGALDWIQARGTNRIACIGFSQGAATIIGAVPQLPPSVRAIVAEGCYTDLLVSGDAHVRHWVGPIAPICEAILVPFLEWRMGWKLSSFAPLDEMPLIKAPVFLMGGTDDDEAPTNQVQQLYDATPGPRHLWMVPHARHVDFYAFATHDYQQRIGAFLAQNMPADAK